MIRLFKVSSLLVFALLLNSCASGYHKINPKSLYYSSKSEVGNIALEYRYDLLEKKYKKKETNNEIKLVAIKITNNSEKDIVFGKDVKLIYDSTNDAYIMNTDKVYRTIKQNPASYLWYLLLSPLQLYSGTKTTNNGYYTETKPASVFPIGLILGPGLAGGNMIAASSANENFKKELTEYDLNGKTIKKRETAYGLVGLYSKNYDAIKLKIQ